MTIDISEEDIDDLAKKLFWNDHPNDIWGVEAIPRNSGHPSGKRITMKDKDKYNEMARAQLEAERDE